MLDQIRTGDCSAFEKLCQRSHARLRRLISLRIDPLLRARVDPSDIVQETQIEAFRRLKDYLRREPMPFHLWLRKMAQERLAMARRFHVLARRRSVQREAALPAGSSLQLVERLLAADSGPHRQLDRKELARLIQNAVSKLSDNDREVIIMRNAEQLSNQEVSQILEIKAATVSQRYGRALLRLRTLLIEGGLLEP